jgi:hypothetical protein
VCSVLGHFLTNELLVLPMMRRACCMLELCRPPPALRFASGSAGARRARGRGGARRRSRHRKLAVVPVTPIKHHARCINSGRASCALSGIYSTHYALYGPFGLFLKRNFTVISTQRRRRGAGKRNSSHISPVRGPWRLGYDLEVINFDHQRQIPLDEGSVYCRF